MNKQKERTALFASLVSELDISKVTQEEYKKTVQGLYEHCFNPKLNVKGLKFTK
jgi:phosphosulfolactate synthase (CoM biosynthesis protein A)